MPRARDSEFRAYKFIEDDLKERGWDTRNPSRHDSGQVWTQNECLQHPEIKAQLGLDRPENVVKVREEVLWVIEAKGEHRNLDLALKEAEDYARKINKSKTLKAPFISGVAGDEATGYLVRTRSLVGGEYKPITINGRDISALISLDEAETVLDSGPAIEDVPVEETLFLSKAQKINEILHRGAINKDLRARVLAALLLALSGETPPNIDAKPSVLIRDINNRAEALLAEHDKPEFFEWIKIPLPPTQDNYIKFKTALVQTIQELNNLNIKSAMNSDTDVLGKFYEVFLKYGNGAKDIGIVLTPRHITKFAVDILNITDRDVVYDPTCGTAGFLVAAFDSVKRNYGEAEVEHFKQNNLFGVDQDAQVVALAVVNMIFRGDGKNNITEGNCFHKNIVKTKNGGGTYSPEPPKENELVVSKVLMNPPFALKGGDEREFSFIDHALKQMRDGDLLFCVLPISVMFESHEAREWRKNRLLHENTLVSVITFPPEVFYPVSVHTLGIVVRKGVPHPKEQNVLWARAIHDGFVKVKGKRLQSPMEPDNLPKLKPIAQAFVGNQSFPVVSEPQFVKAAAIDFDDPLLELVPEAYLDAEPPTADEVHRSADDLVRETAALAIRFPNLWADDE